VILRRMNGSDYVVDSIVIRSVCLFGVPLMPLMGNCL
jgi:hypothetical protein